jgi:hypothetical protein
MALVHDIVSTPPFNSSIAGTKVCRCSSASYTDMTNIKTYATWSMWQDYQITLNFLPEFGNESGHAFSSEMLYARTK